MADNPYSQYLAEAPNPYTQYIQQGPPAGNPHPFYGNPTVDSPDASAGIGTAFHASLMPDVQDQINTYAKARGIPASHYGVINDHIVYLDDKGNYVRETPSVTGATGILDALKRTGQWVTSNARQGADAVAGTVGGLLTSPFLGGVPGAGAAAGATDAGLQYAGRLGSGEGPIDAAKNVDYANAAGQAAMNAGGQLFGNVAGKAAQAAFNTNPLKAAGYDATLLMDPTKRAQWQGISQNADNLGITLTPGELTGSKSLLTQQRQLGRMDNVGSGAKSPMDILADLYTKRNTEQVPNAVQGFAGTLSPNSAVVGAPNFQEGAKGILKTIVENAQKAGSPYYKAAFDSGATADPTAALSATREAMQQWPANSAQYQRLSQIEQSLQKPEQYVRPDGTSATRIVPQDNLRVLHGAKMVMDTLPNYDPVIGADSTLSGQIEHIGNTLRDELVKDPNYRAGNSAYVSNLAPLDGLKAGSIGKIANGQATLGSLLKGGNSMDVAQARASYLANGQESAWNDGVRAHIEDILNNAQKPTQTGDATNVAGKVNQGLSISPRAASNLRVALGDPAKVQALSDLTDVLSRAAKAPAEGSPTATDLGKNGQNLAGPFAKTFNFLASLPKFWDIPQEAGEYAVRRSGATNAAKLATLITNPDSWAALQRMRMMQPGSVAYIQTGTKLLSDLGNKAVGQSGLSNAPDQLPAAAQ